MFCHGVSDAILKRMSNPRIPRPDDADVVTETRTERKLKKPKLYKVLLHNDDYTTMEFVVYVLQSIFHRSETDAVQIMLHVHKNGIGVAGVYTLRDRRDAGGASRSPCAPARISAAMQLRRGLNTCESAVNSRSL